MSPSRVAASHIEWLSLVETTGVFLSVPVVRRVFPNGLDPVPGELRSELRLRLDDSPFDEGWIDWVLNDLLGLREQLLSGADVPERAEHAAVEHGVVLRPTYALVDGNGDLLMSILAFPNGTPRDKPYAADAWAATPLERASILQRATAVPLVLATDGDWFGIAATPLNGAPTSAVWLSSLFGEEPMLLDSFHALLSARRFFAVEDRNTLAAMLTESALAQEEITDRLGTQVRQAVELLVAALSRANRARQGELLGHVPVADVYAGALTVMMRLVFLLYAEERDLLPARQELYQQSYGVLGLRQELQDQADRFGVDSLERRSAAWHRLLAAFRAIYGGIEHESLRLPAYGGGLFDPDRYPFLEGRRDDEPWQSHAAAPLPVDDRTVLAILGALQVLTFRQGGITEARRLSYASLDVEQIGYVYEGLLDHGAVSVDDLAVGLAAPSGNTAEVPVTELEQAAVRGREALVTAITEWTGRTAAQITRGLEAQPSPEQLGRARTACEYDDEATQRVRPFLGLLEEDLRGLPMIFLPGSVYVTKTTERRDTGTQYTPKDLADEIVRYALEPLVYEPGPAGGSDRERWVVRQPEAVLRLRVCDPAVGSGAILVAACRYLSDRLIEAVRTHPAPGGREIQLEPDDPDVGLVARRLVVDHCLYGVDRNPLAVEMTKLSLWLSTLAKERPFSFLDHAIRMGDSLLGVTQLEQLRSLHLDPGRGRKLHSNLLRVSEAIDPLVTEAVDWTSAMKSVQPVTLADVEEQREMSAKADRALSLVGVVADAVVGKAMAASAQNATKSFDDLLLALAIQIRRAVDNHRPEAERNALWEMIRMQAIHDLDIDRPPMTSPRRPLHWPLAFPEVFTGAGAGFDAIVGNPPFSRGRAISGRNGFAYREYLVEHVAGGLRGGSTDLVAYFFRRAASVSRRRGAMGLFATNTISQGDTRSVGLEWLKSGGWSIYRAVKSLPWPGSAAVHVALVWLWHGEWLGSWVLDSQSVDGIGPLLDEESEAATRQPMRLEENSGQAFQGVIHLGSGFLISPSDAEEILARNPIARAVVRPALGGQDLMTRPGLDASRYIIDFNERASAEARAFVEPWQVVEERVQPERAKKDGKKYPRMTKEWWKFWNSRPAMRTAIHGLSRVIVLAQTSNVSMPFRVPADQVFLQSLVVFAFDDDQRYAVLTSSLHWWWAATWGSTFKADRVYAPTDCFETFPMPELAGIDGHSISELHVARLESQARRGIGPTRLYHLIDDPAVGDTDIAKIRGLHIAVDSAVASAYGWDDLDMSRSYEDTRFGRKWTVSRAVRDQFISRLVEINHRRHEREVAANAGGGRSSPGRPTADGQLSFGGTE